MEKYQKRKAKNMNETDYLLNKVYCRTQKASKTLGALLENVENKSLRRDIIFQITEYDKINKEAGEAICNNGKVPQKNLPVKERVNIWGINLSAGVNPSCENIAKIISTESGKNVVEIISSMNSCVNSNPSAYNLARRLVEREESGINKMKPYL